MKDSNKEELRDRLNDYYRNRFPTRSPDEVMTIAMHALSVIGRAENEGRKNDIERYIGNFQFLDEPVNKRIHKMAPMWKKIADFYGI